MTDEGIEYDTIIHDGPKKVRLQISKYLSFHQLLYRG